MKKFYKLGFILLLVIGTTFNIKASNDSYDTKADYTINFNIVDSDSNTIDDAIISINGTTYNAGEYIITIAEGINYPITVEKAGYITYTGTIDVNQDEDVTITLTSAIEINTQPTDKVICGTGTVTLKIVATSNNGQPLTYQWYKDGSAISGGTNENVDVSEEGDYYCKLTAGTDELDSDVANVSIVTLNPQLDDNASVCDGETLTLDPGTFDSYAWSDDASTTTQTLDVSEAGTYTVTVTDANGCTATDFTDVTVVSVEINLTDTVYNCDLETITLSSPMFDSYSWSNGETTQEIEVSEQNTYYLTVTSGACTGVDSTYLKNVSSPEFTLGEDTTTCNSSVILTCPDNTGNATFVWTTSETTQNIEVTTDGTYGVTMTNEFGCEASDEIEVAFLSGLEVDIHTPDTLHACGVEPEVLDAGVGTVWEWSTGADTQTIEIDDQDWYYVTVTDENGCQGNDSVFVDYHTLPTIDLGSDKADCFGNTITINAPSAASWAWSTSETTQSINPTESGVYTCTITDGNGCTAADSLTVTVYPLPDVDLGDDITVTNDKFFTIGVDGGEVDYEWSNGATTSHLVIDASTLSLGTHNYSVTVTTLRGCEDSDDIVVTVIEPSAVPENIKNAVTITPNPTNGIFRVEGNVNDIQIYDNIGKLVLRTRNNSIDISNYPAGVYFVKVAIEDNTKVFKLIKR